jgi:hypothetical protein
MEARMEALFRQSGCLPRPSASPSRLDHASLWGRFRCVPERGRRYDLSMAATTQKLRIGQEVEVDGRLYEVVPDQQGGVTLEAAITLSADEIIARTGGRRATPEEFEEWFGDIPSDGEG